MCDLSSWAVNLNRDIITKTMGTVSGRTVTALKILRGTLSVFYWLSGFIKLTSLGFTILSGGLALLAAIGLGFSANIAIALFLVEHLPIWGLTCALSVGLVPFLNFLRHRMDLWILLRELPQNLPIDIRRTLRSANDMRTKLGTIIPQGYSLGGTRKFSIEIAADVRLPLANNVEYPHKIHLAEILKGTEVIGYVARGKDNNTYSYIKHNGVISNFWASNSWHPFSTSAEFSSALGA
ncbi:MAG: hypothetical protein LBB26_00665 [Puniceicoccales bacterium]|jgi:hypothetical protein|nr:hypothetical protein [Puniceicoccales bacterium]